MVPKNTSLLLRPSKIFRQGTKIFIHCYGTVYSALFNNVFEALTYLKLCGINSATWQYPSVRYSPQHRVLAWLAIGDSITSCKVQMLITAASVDNSLQMSISANAEGMANLYASITVQNMLPRPFPPTNIVKMPIRVISLAFDFCVLLHRSLCIL
jgi:hypothetical protein